MSVIAGVTNRLARPHLPGRTVRVRMTLLYGALFLVSGAALLAVTYLLVRHAVAGQSASGDSFSPAPAGVSPAPGVTPLPGAPGPLGGGEGTSLQLLPPEAATAIERQRSAVL